MSDQAPTARIPSRRLFLAAGPAGAVFGSLATAAQASAAPQDDAEIFQLTAAYNDAWAREREALALERDDEFEERYRAAADATGAIVDQLIAARPRTLAGVRAKAEALNWCHGERFEGLCGSSPGSAPLGCLWPPSTDQRLADAILFDLLALPNPIAV